MVEAILTVVVSNLFEIVASIISILVAQLVVPWLKEKHIYSLVVKGVQAAEKLGQTGQIPKIDKKGYVISFLTQHNITITPEIETLIESACYGLDMIINETTNTLIKEDDDVCH